MASGRSLARPQPQSIVSYHGVDDDVIAADLFSGQARAAARRPPGWHVPAWTGTRFTGTSAHATPVATLLVVDSTLSARRRSQRQREDHVLTWVFQPGALWYPTVAV